MTSHVLRRTRKIGALAVVLALTAAACGDDDDDDAATTSAAATVATTAAEDTQAPADTEAPADTQPATTAATSATGATTEPASSEPAGDDCVAKAEAYIADGGWDENPTTLPPEYTPLSAPPEPGTIIKLVNGNIPSDGQSADEQAVAAEAIGWTAKQIVFDGTVEDVNAKFMQAVNENPTAITIAGWPVGALQQSIDAAAEAGIIVSLSSVPDPVTGTADGGYAVSTNGAETAELIGELNAYWTMRDSGCQAHVAVESLDFPIIEITADKFKETLEANCPDCEVTTQTIPVTDIGTPAASGAMVSQIQADPSIDYMYTIIGNLAAGLPAAFDQAGISGVKIFGQVPDPLSIQSLRDGTSAWWVNQTSTVQGWTELDGVLRVLDTGEPYEATAHPLSVLTPENVPAEGDDPVFPEDFREQFIALWTPS